MTWHKLQSLHWPQFANYLVDQNRWRTLFAEWSQNLEAFLKVNLDDDQTCAEFLEAMPMVLGACDDPKTYALPNSGFAYAYLHFLPRFDRLFRVYQTLFSHGLFPMRTQGPAIIDIGTGPGVSIYAYKVFHDEIQRYARTAGVRGLETNKPTFAVVESSNEMSRFLHRFSEFIRSDGPFGSTFSDFHGVDFTTVRHDTHRTLLREWTDDLETSESFARSLLQDNGMLDQSIFTYNFAVLSNFLTPKQSVDEFSQELSSLARNLRIGGSILVLGATGGNYPKIYKRFDALAQEQDLQLKNEIPTELSNTDEKTKSFLKDFYLHVWEVVASHPKANNIKREFERMGAGDLLDASIPLRMPTSFSVRFFKRLPITKR